MLVFQQVSGCKKRGRIVSRQPSGGKLLARL
jgi:hypothetical protein